MIRDLILSRLASVDGASPVKVRASSARRRMATNEPGEVFTEPKQFHRDFVVKSWTNLTPLGDWVIPIKQKENTLWDNGLITASVYTNHILCSVNNVNQCIYVYICICIYIYYIICIYICIIYILYIYVHTQYIMRMMYLCVHDCACSSCSLFFYPTWLLLRKSNGWSSQNPHAPRASPPSLQPPVINRSVTLQAWDNEGAPRRKLLGTTRVKKLGLS